MIITWACGSEETDRAGLLLRDSAEVRLVEFGDSDDLVLFEWLADPNTAVVIGGDEEREGHDLFGVPNAAILSDGRIVVPDGGSQELRFFSADGDFGGRSGGRGQGPGEFESLSWLGVIRGDSIVVYDWTPRRLSTFTGDGSFVRSVRVTPPHEGSFPEPRGVFADGEFVTVPGFNRVFGQGERRDTVVFILHDRAGGIRDTLAVLPGREEFFAQVGEAAIRTEVPFGRDAFAAMGGMRIAVGTNDRYEVSLIEYASRRLQAIIRSRSTPQPVREEDVVAWKQERLARLPEEARDAFAQAYSDLPTRPTYPAFTGISVGANGSIWVREPVTPDEPLAVWIVYGHDGTPVARARTAVDERIVAIGMKHVVTLGRDQLEREVLRVYAWNVADSQGERR